MPKKKPDNAPEKTLESKYIFKGRALNLRVDTIITADGRRTTREIVEHRGAVVVVPLDAEDNVLMVNQYRTPLAKNLLEIPAGGIEKGEDDEAAVIREMQEETGFKPQKLVFLAGFYSTPGFSNEYLHLYLATDLVPSRRHAEDTADIKLVRAPVGKVREMILSGKIQDAKSIAGLLFMLEWRKKKSKLSD
ncbi:MAG: NUDIX hydrolase [Dehalococcoidales bacterium]